MKNINMTLLILFITTISLIVWLFPLVTNNIGQIEVEKGTSFSICEGRIYEYYSVNTSYKGGRKSLRNQVFEKFKNCIKDSNFKFSGVVNIRFIVNCKGKAGNYIIKTINKDYSPIKISSELRNKLIKIIKKAQNWNSGRNNQKKLVNSYYQINLKVENNHLKELF